MGRNRGVENVGVMRFVCLILSMNLNFVVATGIAVLSH